MDHAGTERHLYTDAGSLGMPKRIPAPEVAKQLGLLEMRRQEYKDRFRISERRDCRIPKLTGGYPDFNCRKFALR